MSAKTDQKRVKGFEGTEPHDLAMLLVSAAADAKNAGLDVSIAYRAGAVGIMIKGFDFDIKDGVPQTCTPVKV